MAGVIVVAWPRSSPLRLREWTEVSGRFAVWKIKSLVNRCPSNGSSKESLLKPTRKKDAERRRGKEMRACAGRAEIASGTEGLDWRFLMEVGNGRHKVTDFWGGRVFSALGFACAGWSVQSFPLKLPRYRSMYLGTWAGRPFPLQQVPFGWLALIFCLAGQPEPPACGWYKYSLGQATNKARATPTVSSDQRRHSSAKAPQKLPLPKDTDQLIRLASQTGHRTATKLPKSGPQKSRQLLDHLN